MDGAAGLAVRDGRLAVASIVSGKVHLFDCSDPKNLKLLATVGQGDGPYGPFAPDRFGFQRAEDRPGYSPALALGKDGLLAVADRNRLSVFDANGKSLWHTFGIFGVGAVPNYSDRSRFFEFDGNWSYRLNLQNGTWKPEGLWHQPPLPKGSMYLGDFQVNGKPFGVYSTGYPKFGPHQGLLIVKLQDFKQIPVVSISYDEKQKAFISRKDTNHDGTIDEADTGELFAKMDGLFFSYNRLQSNGDIVSVDNFSDRGGVKVLPCSGLDADGVPQYRFADHRVITQPKDAPFISPYSYKPESGIGVSGVTPSADGGYAMLGNLRSNPGGAGLFNGVGTDPLAIDASGRTRWCLPTARHQGIYNIWTVGEVSLTGVGTTAALVAFDKDGLGLGSFNQPSQAHYNGYWLDHKEALYAWQGSDGNTYAMICDNFNGCDRWWRLDPKSLLSHSTFPVPLGDTSAQTLAALQPPDMKLAAARAATAAVKIPRLKQALPIDGDLKKWREAGISPNIIITPETAVAGINGPRDCSAVIRMAYHDSDLYVQVLRFDDVVSFHQPVERHFMQDCVEMCINGFGAGFKFDITRTTDKGDIIIRQRFFGGKLDSLLAADHAPRVIQVLDDATAVPERELIESIYGEDLSRCKVIVTEFKLPIDDVTYAGAKDAKFAVAPGKTFWLGFMIDDNDEPGSDVQRLMVWPATYGTFNPPEDGAVATFGE